MIISFVISHFQVRYLRAKNYLFKTHLKYLFKNEQNEHPMLKNLHHILFFVFLLSITSILSFSNDFRQLIFDNTQIDTIGHCIGFFCLTWVLSSLVKLPSGSLVFALILYSAFSELAQLYLGFRNGEIKDFVADVIGILLFMLLKWVWLVYGKSLFGKLPINKKSF